jgi:hypothetical protein
MNERSAGRSGCSPLRRAARPDGAGHGSTPGSSRRTGPRPAGADRSDRDSHRRGQPQLRQRWPPTTTPYRFAVHGSTLQDIAPTSPCPYGVSSDGCPTAALPSLPRAPAAAARTNRCPVHAHGSPLCQDPVGSGVLSWVSAGPGSDFSEEPAWGCELVTLESVVVSRCPPGSAAVAAAVSLIMVR